MKQHRGPRIVDYLVIARKCDDVAGRFSHAEPSELPMRRAWGRGKESSLGH
jgi:hypothetical protein